MWARRLGLAIAGTIAWIYFLRTEPGQKFEFAVHTALVQARGPIAPPSDVVVVAMDEATYETLELPSDRPLPRSIHAKLIKKLGELGAARVVYDVLFLGPSSNPEWDQQLADSMAHVPVYLGANLATTSVLGQNTVTLSEPDPMLADKAAGSALVNMLTIDGTARYFFTPPKMAENYVTLSEAGAGLKSASERASRELPTTNDLINYYGRAGTIKTYSISMILEEEMPFPAEKIRGKVVYVGLSMKTGLGRMEKDSFQTPFGDVFGVEIHASQAANIMQKSWIRRPSMWEQMTLGGFICFLVCLVAVSLRPLAGILFTFSLFIGWTALAYFGLKMNVFLAGAGIVCIAVPILSLINTGYWYLRTRKKQKQIEGAFACYLSPTMVRELKKNPNLLKLGGEELVCSAIFTDIKGFTTISEQLGPLRVVAMLNAYFSKVSDAVTDEGGTVIKFIGDAVFAIWGAPLPQEDHAQRAVRAALRIQQVVEEFNTTGEYPKLVTRVGVNTGKMVVGNLGSSSRFDYTAIGDAVNLAARVEGVNKYLGTTVLVTENAYTELGEHNFEFLRMGAIKVLGKDIPVSLFCLHNSPVDPKMKEEWLNALDVFSKQEWEKSAAMFTEIQQKWPSLEVASKLYLHSMESLKDSIDKEKWRGEISMSEK